MKVKREMFVSALMLIMIFSVQSVYSGRGGGHGHGGHGHGGHGHGGSGHGSSSHGSSGHGDSGHGSSGHGDGGHGSSGHGESGIGSDGSHSSGGHPGSHVDGQSHHDIGDGNSASGNNYPHHNHHHHHHNGHGTGTNGANGSDESWINESDENEIYVPRTTTTTTTARPTPPPRVDETWLPLTCDNRLPAFMGKNYPKEKVVSAVQALNNALSSDGRNARSSIKFEVQEFLIMLNIHISNFGNPIQISKGCDEVISHIAPLGGCDINNNAFIVVNVPEMKQVVKTSSCRSTFGLCDYSNGGVCLQSTRREKLLTLPAKEGSFNLADFSVATFKVNDGCSCRAGDAVDIRDFFPSLPSFN